MSGLLNTPAILFFFFFFFFMKKQGLCALAVFFDPSVLNRSFSRRRHRRATQWYASPHSTPIKDCMLETIRAIGSG